ncbi:MAG: CoA-binding protein [Candidatus Melainabacteria bacterium]|jgi:uncharacterized protein|nr:CoA-binding protein [Candidatus Melainabacteria bacterium]
MSTNVIVLGASNKPERYSYQAVKLLKELGHNPLAVHPKIKEIDSLPVYSSLKDIKDIKIDTITIYVNPEISSGSYEQILALKPARVIFNPGAENPELIHKLEGAAIHTLEACTLVLLRTGQF